MKPEQKKYLIITITVIALLVIGYWLLGNRNKGNKQESKEPLPTEMVIPTVDQSVRISLTDAGSGKEVLLSISNVPGETESVDYELSYNTAQQGLQGVIGTITGSEDSYEKKLTLGTCSSGACVYHQVVGKIKLSLKFNGSFGEKVFEKEYLI